MSDKPESINSQLNNFFSNFIFEKLKNFPEIVSYILRILSISAFSALLFEYLVPYKVFEGVVKGFGNFVPGWYENRGLLLMVVMFSFGVLVSLWLIKLSKRFLNTVTISANNVVSSWLLYLSVFYLCLWLIEPNYHLVLFERAFLAPVHPFFIAFIFSCVLTGGFSYLYAGICYLIDSISQRKQFKNEDLNLDVDISDEPIVKESDDLLGRIEFVNNFYSQINNLPFKSSFVFSLQGDWGEGKTSVLNLLENRIENDDENILLKFQPWFFEDEKSLLKGFLRDFELVVNKKYLFPSFKKKLHKYRNIITVPMQSFSISKLEGLSDIFEDETLEDVKDRLTDTLLSLDRRVIIFIDDIDRLSSKKEVLQVFKLVKLVGNFPNTTFVLTYDQAIINDLIVRGKKKNKHFLDKIVQKEMYLPKADQKDIDDYLEKYLNELFQKIKNSEKRKAIEDFNHFYLTDLRLIFNTLRKAKRYFNSLRATVVSEVTREINLFDILVMEVLRVFYRPLFEDIWSNRFYYYFDKWNNESFVSSPLRYIFKDNEINEEIRNHIEKVLKDYSGTENKLLLDILCKVFLSVDKAFNKQNYDFSNQAGQYRADRRIAHPEVFRKYFMQKEREGEILDSEIRTFISLLNKSQNNKLPKVILKTFREYKKRDSLLNFASKLDLFHGGFKKEKLGIFVKAFYQAILSMKNLTREEIDEIFVLMYRLINENEDKRLIHSILSEIVSEASLYVSVKTVNWATSDEPAFFNIKQNADKDVLKELLNKRFINRFIKGGKDIFKTDKRYVFYFLHNWGKCLEKGRKAVNKYIKALTKNKNQYIVDIIKSYAIYWEHRNPQIRYDELIEVYDEDYFFKRLQKMESNKLKIKDKQAVDVFNQVYNERHGKKDEKTFTKTQPDNAPAVELKVQSISSSKGKYSAEFWARNIGKESTTLEYIEITGAPRLDLSRQGALTPEDRVKITMSLEGSDFQQGKHSKPLLNLVYKDLSGNRYKTTYQIKTQKRDDGLVNLDSIHSFELSKL